jgi:hypothetical protein
VRLRRWRVPMLAATVSLITAAMSTGGAAAVFRTSPTAAANAFTSKQIFPGVRTTAAYDIRDAAAGGAAANVSVQPDFADGVTFATGAWGAAFSTTRYVEFVYNAPLATPGSVTSPSFTFRFADPSTGTACFYFDVRRASDSGLISTYGSAAAPVACQTGTTLTTSTTALAATDLATNAAANDVRIRLYGKESSAVAGITIDQATVGLTQWATSSTLHLATYVDNSAGTTPATYSAPLTTADGTIYATGVWSSAFSSTRYVQLTFPAYVPPGAVVTSATITHAYRTNTSGGLTGNTCYYLDVIANGTTTTHGSSASPVGCTNSTTSVTETIPVPEITTGTQADTLVVKLYGSNSKSKNSEIDQFTLALNYYLT